MHSSAEAVAKEAEEAEAAEAVATAVEAAAVAEESSMDRVIIVARVAM